MSFFYGEATATSRSQNKVLRHYPHSGGASSAGGGHVESCARQISWDPIGFCVRLCRFMLVSFDHGCHR
jgi:hypothetical protein